MSEISMDAFIKLHRSQLELSVVPKFFWDTLYNKLKHSIFDAGEVFSLLQVDYDTKTRGEYDPPWTLQVKNEEGIQASDPNHLYLVDHAWTFRIENARKQLRGIDSLRQRMASLVGLDTDTETTKLSEQIFDEMWKYCDCYWTANAESVENRVAVWYMMDEVGSAIQHSETPNFRVVPFIHIPEQIVYSLIFPITDLSCGEIVTRNFVERPAEIDERQALVLPWIYTSFLDVNFVNVEPSPDYFLSGHIPESLPILSKLKCDGEKRQKYKVYAEYILIHQYLTDEAFVIVDNEEQADILWKTTHFKNFEELSATPHKFINQFPFEYVLTIKDLLCIIGRRKADKNCNLISTSSPPWLPTTYNLKTELAKFVSYYQHRNKEGLDNHWIIKPFNLARGLDTHITNNLNYILRLPVTGPKIAQKYIDNPILFYRPECCGKVKFDIRYVLLVKSTKPVLEAYVYKKFFLRFANQPFEMQNFDEYTKHFTVMNYIDDAKNLKHMLCDEFEHLWEQQYMQVPWGSVEKEILKMLREVIECATMECPPCGISESPQSRALYAADIMLEWTDNGEIQPKLLEINWTPDCRRACEYYPNFFNDIFKLLFLDVNNSEVFYAL